MPPSVHSAGKPLPDPTPTGGPMSVIDFGSEFNVSSKAGIVSVSSSETFNVKHYGAKGDGVHDDTAAIQAAINAWVSFCLGDLTGAAVLLFPPGEYKTTSTLTATFNGVATSPKMIEGYGAVLKPVFASGDCLAISVVAPNAVRNLDIDGLGIDGANLSSTTGALLHMSVTSTAGFLYRFTLKSLGLEHFNGDGIRIGTGAFEGSLIDCHIEAATANQTGTGLYMDGTAGAGSASSIDIYGGTFSLGLHNIYATQCAPKIHGGTFLEAWNEAIYFDSSVEGYIAGAHIENAWQGGVASPGWSANQAGILAINAVTLIGVAGACENNKMRYVARVFADNPCVILGGIPLGLVGPDYYLRAEGPAKITAVGVGCGVTGAIDDHAGGPLLRLGVRPDVSGTGTAAIQMERGSTQGTVAGTNYTGGGSLSIDASLGDTQQIIVSSATAFTINAPSNPPQGNHSQRISVEVTNLSGGAMGAITWTAGANGFHFAGLTWTNPASGLIRRAVFEWSVERGQWICTSVSQTDY